MTGLQKRPKISPIGQKYLIFDIFFLFLDKFWSEKVVSHSFTNSFQNCHFLIEMGKICGWSLEPCLNRKLKVKLKVMWRPRSYKQECRAKTTKATTTQKHHQEEYFHFTSLIFKIFYFSHVKLLSVMANEGFSSPCYELVVLWWAGTPSPLCPGPLISAQWRHDEHEDEESWKQTMCQGKVKKKKNVSNFFFH